jgi:hypothetical protein
MTRPLKSLLTPLTIFAFLAGCAASTPVPFQLIDAASKVQKGSLFTDNHRIEVTVDGHLFSGFYIVASSAAFSQTIPTRRYYPRETLTTFISNSARAHLTSNIGQRLSCEFLLEAKRALGECKTPAGATFQLVADGIN